MITNSFSAHGGWVVPESSFAQIAKAIALSYNTSVEESVRRVNSLLHVFRKGPVYDNFDKAPSTPSGPINPEILKLAFLEFSVSERGLEAVGAVDNLPHHPSQTDARWKTTDCAFLALAVARETIKSRGGPVKDIFKDVSVDEVASLVGTPDNMRNLDGAEINISHDEKVIRLDCYSESGRETLEAWSLWKTLNFCLESIRWESHPDAGGGLKTVELLQHDSVLTRLPSFTAGFGRLASLEEHDEAMGCTMESAPAEDQSMSPSAL